MPRMGDGELHGTGMVLHAVFDIHHGGDVLDL